MTGQNSIIRLRLRGYAPPEVWVFLCDKTPHFYPAWHPELDLENGFRPGIHVMPDDIPGLLDFRCLVGVTVHVIGTNRERCTATAERILSVHPSRVLASGWGDMLDLTPEKELS